MAELVTDCPRCGAEKMTFDVSSTQFIGQEYGWQHWFEAFSVCRNCKRSSIFVLAQRDIRFNEREEIARPYTIKGVLNNHFDVDGFINIAHRSNSEAPEHTPDEIAAVFKEGASSISIGNWNAAGAMFRLAINLATKPLLPDAQVPGLTRRKRRDLGPRVEWLMQNGFITKDLFDLSECIREDGNDGAHDGTLTKEEAADVFDFTTALFERLYTEPERLRLAKERRDKRRAASGNDRS